MKNQCHRAFFFLNVIQTVGMPDDNLYLGLVSKPETIAAVLLWSEEECTTLNRRNQNHATIEWPSYRVCWRLDATSPEWHCGHNDCQANLNEIDHGTCGRIREYFRDNLYKVFNATSALDETKQRNYPPS